MLTVDALDMVLIAVLVFLVLRQIMPIAAGLRRGVAQFVRHREPRRRARCRVGRRRARRRSWIAKRGHSRRKNDVAIVVRHVRAEEGAPPDERAAGRPASVSREDEYMRGVICLVPYCADAAPHGVRCDGHLPPINAPAATVDRARFAPTRGVAKELWTRGARLDTAPTLEEYFREAHHGMRIAPH